VRLIWANAKEYNETGSDIYMMAERLEVLVGTPSVIYQLTDV